ncbi:MAG: hypothetical protein AUJ92_22210 [Armatimonadetes bacterium CG2_30_59_28]|nr:DUF4838 domain-containing protein [Armatimonadota bacterium]OIO89166.1 MAG: hypothetical protein AUJ92_22210 [Armatimonadetes bacterium CG2_30_59_28]PIU63802.1 MAG: hypothetical protein COS85_14950 [Armatimonadetes bacterium CG07_land_8_20_14_0_80_59_28]PIX45105.1 MAG: hypothetical protein COZ56_02665 [Armatimonadetes bacterium CG_4_8_14_3_um_filter_58_9]PIY38257.1 MAG: hypothetical protein COZ05_21035 [Armatimonadetes bacterium CG_4_10_14_3_um_filter_59_10]
MQRLKLIYASMAAFCWFCTPAHAQEQGSILNRDSNIRIMELGDFGNASGWLKELLEKYLLQALGKKELAGTGETVSFIIEAESIDWQHFPQGSIKDPTDIDSFEVAIQAGKDKVVRITGRTVLAAGFGVMHFLENYIGVTWLFPGELGIALPDKQEFNLAEGTERVTPAFASRLFTGFAYRDPTIPASRFVYEGLLHEQSVFFYSYDYFKSLRPHFLASPSHNMINIFPLSTRNTDPDILPLKNGKTWIPPDKDSPQGKVGWWQAWHPCYTKQKTVDIAAAKAKEAFEKGDFCFSLGINDGKRVQCECDECKRVGWPQSYYQFVARVAERVKRFYPPRLVGLIVYGDVRNPPPDLRLPDNVLAVCVGGGEDVVESWKRHARHIGVYEYFHGQGFWVPNFPLAAMRANAQQYRDGNVKFYRAEMHPLWAYDAPRIYLRTRLLWDTDFDTDKGLRRFCDAAFGAGGKAMYDFYTHWAKLRDKDVVRGGISPMSTDGHWRNFTRQIAECTRGDFTYAGECIGQAKSLAKSAKQRQRLEMVETFFEDTRTLFEMSELAQRVFGSNSASDPVADFATALSLRERRIELMKCTQSHPEWFAGTTATVSDRMIPSWEDRYAPVVLREMDNVLLTSLLRATDQGKEIPALPEELRTFARPMNIVPSQLYLRDTHGWFPEWRYAPIPATKTGAGFEFRLAESRDRIVDHPALGGKRKSGWVASFSPLIPTDQNLLCCVDLQVSGMKGRLQTWITWGSNNTSRTETESFDVFGEHSRAIQRRIVLRPVHLNRETLQADPQVPTGDTGRMELFFVWEPDADVAPVSGTCNLSVLRLGAANP